MDDTMASQELWADFNASLPIFLPKQACGETEEGEAVYEVDGVRPFNVTSTDNRLMASACRWMLEPLLGSLITDEQRGFIQGRSMLSNTVDI